MNGENSRKEIYDFRLHITDPATYKSFTNGEMNINPNTDVIIDSRAVPNIFTQVKYFANHTYKSMEFCEYRLGDTTNMVYMMSARSQKFAIADFDKNGNRTLDLPDSYTNYMITLTDNAFLTTFDLDYMLQ